MPTPSTSTIILAFSLALSSTGFAQVVQNELDESVELSLGDVALPTSGSTGHGDFDGDLYEDVFHFDDGELQVMLSVGNLEVRMTTGILGDRAVSGPGSNGQEDIFLCGPNGLVRVTWVESLSAFQATTLDSLWGATTDMDAYLVGTTLHIVGLVQGGQAVRRAQISGSGSVQVAQYSLGYATDEIELVQWNGTGAPELADVDGGHLRVRLLASPTQILFQQTYASFDYPILRRLSQAGSSAQWLAWIGAPTGFEDLQNLAVFGSSGLVFLDTLPDPVDAMESADYDNDGRQDLLLSLRDQNDIGLLINSGTTYPVFQVNGGAGHPQLDSYAEYILTGVAGSPGNVRSRVTAADFDNDGDCDLGLHVYDQHLLWVGKDTRIVDQGAQTPSLVVESVPGIPDGIGVWLDSQYMLPMGDGSYAGDLGIALEIALPPTRGLATHVEIAAWTIDVLGATGLAPIAFHSQQIPLEDFVDDRYPVWMTLTDCLWDGDAGGDAVGMNDLVECMWRLIQVDNQGQTLVKYPSRLIGFQAYMDESDPLLNPVAAFLWTEEETHPIEATNFTCGVLYAPELPGDDGTGSGTGTGNLPCANNTPPSPR